MFLRNDVNEYGTDVVWFKCDMCESEYSVCPAPDDVTSKAYNVCMIHPCESYDPRYDIDVIFMSDKELAIHADKVGVVDFEILGKRRKHQSGDNQLTPQPPEGRE